MLLGGSPSPRSSATARSPRRTWSSRAAPASSSRSGWRWPSPALVITTATLALSVPVGIALIRSRDGNVTIGAQFWQTVVAAFVVLAAYGVIGVAIGALVRNQIVAVVGVLVWMLAVEQIVVTSLPVGRTVVALGSHQRTLPDRPRDGPRREAAVVARGRTAAVLLRSRSNSPRLTPHTQAGRPMTGRSSFRSARSRGRKRHDPARPRRQRDPCRRTWATMACSIVSRSAASGRWTRPSSGTRVAFGKPDVKSWPPRNRISRSER